MGSISNSDWSIEILQNGVLWFHISNGQSEFDILSIMNCSTLGNATDVIHLDYYSIWVCECILSGIGNSTIEHLYLISIPTILLLLFVINLLFRNAEVAMKLHNENIKCNVYILRYDIIPKKKS